MTDRELLELIAAQVGNLTNRMDNLTNQAGTLTTDMKGVKGELTEVKGEVKEVKGEIKEVKGELKKVKERVIKIEDDHGKKLDLLFDGYRQNSDKLDRIEREVSKHEEVILRRIK